eukprot:6950485-Pyramimonas_sp.AAC.1
MRGGRRSNSSSPGACPPGGGFSYSGDPCQETLGVPPGCPGFLGFRWFCDGNRDVPAPEISGRSG